MSICRTFRRVVGLVIGVLSVCAATATTAEAAFYPVAPPIAAGTPAAGGSISLGSCTHDRHSNGAAGFGGDGQARTGGNEDAQCQGAGTQTITAGVGQQSSVVGPAVTASVVNAPIQTSAGAAAAAGGL